MVCKSGCVDMGSLCIIKGVQCWALYVDVTVLLTGGNLFDAVGLAALAALRTTHIPKVAVISDGSEGPIEVQVSENPEDYTLLNTDDVPVAVTITQIGGKHHVADVSASEEACMSAQVIVAVNSSGKTCMVRACGAVDLLSSFLTRSLARSQWPWCSLGHFSTFARWPLADLALLTFQVQMGGGAMVAPATLTAMIESGRRVGVKLVKKVHECLRAEAAAGKPPLGFLA